MHLYSHNKFPTRRRETMQIGLGNKKETLGKENYRVGERELLDSS